MRKILLNLEISTKCRAACSMCPRKHVPKNKFIDDDLVNIISKELDDTFWEIDLSGRGEPTLHPKFHELSRIIKNNSNTQLAVVTTADNLTDKVNDTFREYIDVIRLSVSSYDEKIFKKVHCGLNYNKIWDNIKRLGNEHAYKTVIHLTGGSVIYEGLEITVEKLREIGFREFRLFPLWNRAGDNEVKAKEEEFRHDIIEKLGLRSSESEYDGGNSSDYINDYKRNKLTNPKYCIVGDSSLFITYNGDILGCFQDFSGKCIVANIRNSNLKDIIKHKKDKVGRYEFCSNCNSNIAILNITNKKNKIMNYQLSVGFNGKKDTLLKIINSSNKVGDVYTGGLSGKIYGGRFQYEDSYEKIKENIEICHKHGITLSITLNSPSGVPEKSDKIWWDDIANYLCELESIGVDKVICSHPFLISLAKEKTNLIVVASTIAEISNVRSALYYEELGADIIVPSVSINHDLKELILMKDNLQHATLKILVNEVCLGNCPYRRFHHAHLSKANHRNYDIDYTSSCTKKYLDNPYLFLTNNVIRPEDLKLYEGICDNFKLVGRTIEDDILVNMIKAYGNEYYDGNLLDILDNRFQRVINIPNNKLNELIYKKMKCDKNCAKCGYCKDLYTTIQNEFV